MRCFNHAEIRAVGICKRCNKALCHDCANDLGFGLACRNTHEQEVKAVNRMVDRATQVQSVNTSNRYLSALFFMVIGAFFAGYDIYTGNGGSGFGLWLGVLFVAYGSYVAVVVRRAYASAKA